MGHTSLEEELQSAASPVEYLRSLDVGAAEFPHVPDEFTHWIEEQRSWRETCCLADQSHHMTELHVEGPDALELFSTLGVNRFDPFPVGQAKQLVVCSPDGYTIGDGILFHLGPDEFLLVGGPAAPNWVEYHVETGGYEATAERQGSSRFDQAVDPDPSPHRFRFQIQGPAALAVMAEATQEPLPDLPFFHFDSLTIAGHKVQALRHGMAGEAGYEFWGPYEHVEAVRDAVLAAGEAHGLRQLGTRSYQTTPVVVGWVPLPLPAVYSKDTADYRAWLDADGFEGRCSLGGSFVGDDITDYYLNPVELGHAWLVDLDHDFVGRDAVAARIDDPRRQLVTLEWDADDLVDVYGTLFADGPTAKFVDLLEPRWSAVHYDAVRKGGDLVGVSKWAGYIYNERAMLSLAVVDIEHAAPGTEVSLLWGEADASSNRAVERHEQTALSATVAPVPYSEDRR